MIGSKMYCLFRDSYGNGNGGVHYCEVLDKVMIIPTSQKMNHDSRFSAETHYLVMTLDPSPEIRSEDFRWKGRLALVRPQDLMLEMEKQSIV